MEAGEEGEEEAAVDEAVECRAVPRLSWNRIDTKAFS